MSVRDRIKVLVVDDMSTSRGILLQALDALGIRNVAHVGDGEAALRQVRMTSPHLVLSDLHMPGMNGLELLQSLRTSVAFAKIGFILVSGRSDPTMLEAGRRLGMNNFLAKPYTHADLKVCLETVAGRL